MCEAQVPNRKHEGGKNLESFYGATVEGAIFSSHVFPKRMKTDRDMRIGPTDSSAPYLCIAVILKNCGAKKKAK